MPYPRPTISEITKRRISDYEYELGSQNTRIPGTIEYGLATSGSGTAHGLHGRISAIAKDAFPHSALRESLYRWASFYGIFPNPAVRSSGVVDVAGAQDTPIPVGTEFTRSDGAEFTVTVAGIIGDPNIGHGWVTVEAKVAGQAGDTKEGTLLTLKNPIAGLQSNAYVQTKITGGTDVEGDLSLRGRLLARLSSPPKGGGPGDYIRWAKQVSGVTRAWEYGRVPKAGHVTVLFMRDNDEIPFPDALAREAVEAELLKHAPLHLHGLHVVSPIKKVLTPSIQLTVAPNADVVATRSAIVKAIQDMLATQAAPSKTDGGVFYKSWISQAISNTPGELDHKLTVPAGDITIDQWELLTLESEADVDWS